MKLGELLEIASEGYEPIKEVNLHGLATPGNSLANALAFAIMSAYHKIPGMRDDEEILAAIRALGDIQSTIQKSVNALCAKYAP